jgi:hypothetical protein
MLFNNPKRSVYAIIAFLVLFVVGAAFSTCHSAELDLAYGQTVIRGKTDVIMATVVAPRAVGGDVDLYAGAILIGTSTGPYHSPDMFPNEYKTVEVSNQIMARAGCMVHINRLGMGLGLAAIQHDDLFNSGKLNFNLVLDFRLGKHLRVSYNHISNAGSSSVNLGRDMATLGWRF